MFLIYRLNKKDTLRLCSILLLALSIASCGSSSDATSSGEAGTEGLEATNPGQTSGGVEATATGFSSTLELGGTVQDVWTFEAISVIEKDGNVRDITTKIIDAYRGSAGEPVSISDTATFLEINDLIPSIHTESGFVREHIDVVAGIIETEDRSMLAMIATPDVTVGGLISASDRLQFDITRLDADIPPGMPLSMDYYFAVTTAGDEPDVASGGIALLTERLAAGRFVIQTESPEPDSAPLLLAGNIGTTFEGSLGAGLPAKSQPLICGLPSASGKCGPLCAGRALYDIYQGFKESWTSIDANFGPGTGSSTPPTNKCPPDSDCGQSGNDPHVRTFDGLSYSPQAVGEFTAIDYRSANSSIEMQWRFSPGVNNRTVSFITAVALNIDGTRLTIDSNRDNKLEIDGQAVTFNDMGIPFIGDVMYEPTNGITVGSPRGSIYITTGEWSWLISFGARGFIAGQQWIKTLITTPRGQSDIRGMFGNANANPEDDLMSRDGSFVVPALSRASVADVYDSFVNTWRITDAISLLDYNTGETTATYTDLSFPDFPNLTNERNTPLSIATRSLSADSAQAEAICRVAGVNEQPSFDECVTDILSTGSFEIANDSKVMAGTDDLIQKNRFGSEIDGKDLQWWHSVKGSLSPRDGNIVGNSSVTLVTTEVDDTPARLHAFDTSSGFKLWDWENAPTRCGAALLGENRVLLQLPLAADPSGGIVLLDARTGTELSRYTPTEGVLRACPNALEVNSKSQVFHVTGNIRRAFDIVDDIITLRWEHTFDEDPLLANFSGTDAFVVLVDDVFTIAVETGEASLFRIDSDTGMATQGVPIRALRNRLLQVGGDNLLIVSGTGEDDIVRLEGFNVALDSPNIDIAFAREIGETVADGLTRAPYSVVYNSDGFAGWANLGSVRGIGRFSPVTGFLEWHAVSSSFDNNGQLVGLSDGGFAISPFGSSNFLEAIDREGNASWSIPSPSGTGFPVGLHATGKDMVVMVSRSRVNPSDTAIVSVGTRR